MTWLVVLIPLLIIGLAIGAYFLFGSGVLTGDSSVKDKDAAQPIELDKDYYVLVRTIELYPNRPDGKQWDINDSAPDIKFKIDWQNNTVFEGDKQSDTLIGSWEALSLDLKQAILSQKVDLGTSIDAAIIKIQKDTTATLTVWDVDLGSKDQAGVVPLKLDQMVLGDNVMLFDADPENAIKRIVVRLIDKSLPISELVEEATRP